MRVWLDVYSRQVGLNQVPHQQGGMAGRIRLLRLLVWTWHCDAPKLTHESPVLEGKAPLQWVEWQVAARALGVVVWAGELGAGGLEAAAGDESWGRGGAEGSTGEHLQRSA